MKDKLWLTWPWVNGAIIAMTLIGTYQVFLSDAPLTGGEVVALLAGYGIGSIMSLCTYRVPFGWRSWWFTFWDSISLGVRVNARAWLTMLACTALTFPWLPWPTFWPVLGFFSAVLTLALFIEWVQENIRQIPH